MTPVPAFPIGFAPQRPIPAAYSLRDMCALVSRCLYDTTGRQLSPDAIFTQQPVPRPAAVFFDFWAACAYYGIYTDRVLPDAAGAAQGRIALVPFGKRSRAYCCLNGEWRALGAEAQAT